MGSPGKAKIKAIFFVTWVQRQGSCNRFFSVNFVSLSLSLSLSWVLCWCDNKTNFVTSFFTICLRERERERERERAKYCIAILDWHGLLFSHFLTFISLSLSLSLFLPSSFFISLSLYTRFGKANELVGTSHYRENTHRPEIERDCRTFAHMKGTHEHHTNTHIHMLS